MILMSAQVARPPDLPSMSYSSNSAIAKLTSRQRPSLTAPAFCPVVQRCLYCYFHRGTRGQPPLEIQEMATAKKKAPTKRAKSAPKKATAKKAPARKSPAKKAPGKKRPAKKAAAKKAPKGNFFTNALSDARVQIDNFVDSARLKAKEMAANEKLMQKKVELAAKAEMDKARHLTQQAEKWVKARIKSDSRKLKAMEKKLTRQLRSAERKLAAQARAAERKANKQGRAIKKSIESGATKVLGKAPAKARKKVAAPKKKKATAARSRARAKK
ncbi:MAG: hypothetical protein R3E50_03235 [Halioglobus sp.]